MFFNNQSEKELFKLTLIQKDFFNMQKSDVCFYETYLTYVNDGIRKTSSLPSVSKSHSHLTDIVYYENLSSIKFEEYKTFGTVGYFVEITFSKHMMIKYDKNQYIRFYTEDKDTALKACEYVQSFIVNPTIAKKKIQEAKERIEKDLNNQYNSYCENIIGLKFIGEIEIINGDDYKGISYGLYADENKIALQYRYGASLYSFKHEEPIDIISDVSYIEKDKIDCIYLTKNDVFDEQKYKTYNMINNYNMASAARRASSNQLDNSFHGKIDVGGMIAGAAIGGTAGAILGGMPKNNSHSDGDSFVPITNVDSNFIEADVSQIVIQYSKGIRKKKIYIRDDELLFTDELLETIFGDKLVDTYTGEHYYELKNK